MRRKEVILFMTVGTGINQGSEEEGYKSMANKLYSSINRVFPNFVVFFATEKSKQTIKYIEELFKMENDVFVLVGTAIMIVSIVVGLVISFRAMIKYNKGIF